MTSSTVQVELDIIAAVVSTLRTSPPAVRRRLCRGVSALLASTDGRYLEQIDIHVAALEKAADDLNCPAGSAQS